MKGLVAKEEDVKKDGATKVGNWPLLMFLGGEWMQSYTAVSCGSIETVNR